MKPKAVNWDLITRETDSYDVYKMLDDLMAKFHQDIQGVIIVIMWRHNLKIDVDGHVQLADISRTADKYRELHEHDFILGLNKDTWSMLDDSEKRTVMDSQLNRIAISTDQDGEPKEDDRSRTVYRTKKEQVTLADNESTLTRRHGHSMAEIQNKVASKMKWAEGDDKEPMPEEVARTVEEITGQVNTPPENVTTSVTGA